jgi:hypothetical protein
MNAGRRVYVQGLKQVDVATPADCVEVRAACLSAVYIAVVLSALPLPGTTVCSAHT